MEWPKRTGLLSLVSSRVGAQVFKGWNVLSCLPLGLGILLWVWKHTLWGLVLTLGSLAFVLLLVALGYQREISRMALPLVVLDNVYTKVVSWRARKTQLDPETGEILARKPHMFPDEKVDVLVAAVKNDPPGHRPEAVCSEAVVSLFFYRPSDTGPPVLAFPEIPGRWSQNPQIVDLELGDTKDRVTRRTLHANGERHFIDLTLRHHSDHACYAAADEVWRWGGREESVKLEDGYYAIKIVISGVGMMEPMREVIGLVVESDDDTDPFKVVCPGSSGSGA